jgi:hypothetical protein
MLDENQMIHPARSGGDRDAALDAVLAAADEDMLAAISNGLDLDTGLARVLEDLGGSSATRPATCGDRVHDLGVPHLLVAGQARRGGAGQAVRDLQPRTSLPRCGRAWRRAP